MEVPQLKAGDLIVFRGDVIHTRMPFKSTRVTLSMRTSATWSQITLSQLLNGGPKKFITSYYTSRAAYHFARMKLSGRLALSQAEIKQGALPGLANALMWATLAKEPPQIRTPFGMLWALYKVSQFWFWWLVFHVYVFFRVHLLESATETDTYKGHK